MSGYTSHLGRHSRGVFTGHTPQVSFVDVSSTLWWSFMMTRGLDSGKEERARKEEGGDGVWDSLGMGSLSSPPLHLPNPTFCFFDRHGYGWVWGWGRGRGRGRRKRTQVRRTYLETHISRRSDLAEPDPFLSFFFLNGISSLKTDNTLTKYWFLLTSWKIKKTHRPLRCPWVDGLQNDSPFLLWSGTRLPRPIFYFNGILT